MILVNQQTYELSTRHGLQKGEGSEGIRMGQIQSVAPRQKLIILWKKRTLEAEPIQDYFIYLPHNFPGLKIYHIFLLTNDH